MIRLKTATSLPSRAVVRSFACYRCLRSTEMNLQRSTHELPPASKHRRCTAPNVTSHSPNDKELMDHTSEPDHRRRSVTNAFVKATRQPPPDRRFGSRCEERISPPCTARAPDYDDLDLNCDTAVLERRRCSASYEPEPSWQTRPALRKPMDRPIMNPWRAGLARTTVPRPAHTTTAVN